MKLTCQLDSAPPGSTSCDAFVYYSGYFKNPPQ
jgi:hypothetical protein